jgi:hypothetical protein
MKKFIKMIKGSSFIYNKLVMYPLIFMWVFLIITWIQIPIYKNLPVNSEIIKILKFIPIIFDLIIMINLSINFFLVNRFYNLYIKSLSLYDKLIIYDFNNIAEESFIKSSKIIIEILDKYHKKYKKLRTRKELKSLIKQFKSELNYNIEEFPGELKTTKEINFINKKNIKDGKVKRIKK